MTRRHGRIAIDFEIRAANEHGPRRMKMEQHAVGLRNLIAASNESRAAVSFIEASRLANARHGALALAEELAMLIEIPGLSSVILAAPIAGGFAIFVHWLSS